MEGMERRELEEKENRKTEVPQENGEVTCLERHVKASQKATDLSTIGQLKLSLSRERKSHSGRRNDIYRSIVPWG